LIIPLGIALLGVTILAMQLRAAGDERRLVVIADATADMGPGLSALASAWPGTIIPADPAERKFSLLAYRDQVSLRGSTDSITEFQGMLNELQAGGGGECEDAMLQALRAAGQNLPDSRVLIFGNSAPQGDKAALAFMINKLIARGVRVYPAISDWCDGAKLTPAAMNSLALLTGGWPFAHKPADAQTAARRAFNSISLPDTLHFEQTTVNGLKTIPLTLDSSATTLGVDEDKYIY
jgi:hypothetical protein